MNRIRDEGIDELTARNRKQLIPRVATLLAIAGVATLMIPWTVSATWLALQSLTTIASWWFTQPRIAESMGRQAQRRVLLACLAFGCAGWAVLGALLWATGTAEGAITAAIIWLSVIFFAQSAAYLSATGFVVGGLAPGLAALAFILLFPNPLGVPILPVAGFFLLALVFASDGAFRAVAARQRFAEAQAQLRASEAQYRVLAGNVTDVIALNTLSGRRVFMSPSIEQAMGYTPDELMATSNYTYLHPEDARWVPGEIAKMVRDGGEITLQYRVLHKDGHAVWVETNFGLIPPETPGDETMLVSVSRNIEARKALETELVEARQRAEDAAAAKSEFLANMTHELRTPLNAIIGFSGVLKDSPRLEGEDARHVALIHDASGALLELVNSVLDFSRLEAGAVELEAKPFDPAGPARMIAALLAEQAAKKGLTLSVRTEGETGPLVGDAARIRQVLLNFLSNALKFTREGGVTVTVGQTAETDGRGRLRVEVADTGIGVAPDQIAHLFDRFTQADASVSREYGGTGLGLAICRRTIDLMGGTIGAESRPGEGSTFWFELVLPRAEALAEAAPAEEADAELERPLRLLLVEDVAVNRELIVTLLRPFDIEIETAENGVQAVEAMASRLFDLVLMDVQMPVMDGLSATRAIRALPSASAQSTPIIAMTANVLPEQVETCLAAGMDDHLGKPISPAALLAALSRWSDGREAGAADRAAASA